MPSINLAPGTQHIIIARKRRQRLYAIAVLIIIIFFLGWLGLFIYKQTLTAKSEAITVAIEDVNQKIQALRDDATRVTLFEKRLVDVANLLKNHIKWGQIFADMERLLPPEAVLTSFNATSTSPIIRIDGTTPNLDHVALVLASLTSGPDHPSVFTSGTVKSVQRQEAGEGGSGPSYKFSLELDFNPEVLSAPAI